MPLDYNSTLTNFGHSPRGARFASALLCEDYHWGELINGNVVRSIKRNEGKIFDPNLLTNDSVIIVIAESPHKCEFLFKNKILKGFTSPLHKCDKKIKKFLESNANSLFKKNIPYDVVLVNAIQYQCSFGLSLWGEKNRGNRKLKNNVFAWTWKQLNAQDDLLKRVDAITKNKKEVIIVNACVKELKVYCNSKIFTNTNNAASFCVVDRNHPSSWPS